MTSDNVTTQEDLGRRIATGRETAGLTQLELADAVGIDRTAVAKVERGSRRVSATELVRIAAALDRPVDWFVSEPPPAVISRREDVSVNGRSKRLDATVDRVGRDVAFLLLESVLPARERESFATPESFEAAAQLAERARGLLSSGDGPLFDLQRACEQLGLLAFSLSLGDGGGDAAYVDVDGWGVAVVNGDTDPGRRRFNLAHELGHHLVGDAYAAEVTITAGDETEKLLNAFAAYLLMPRSGVTATWNEFSDRDRRLAAIAVATRYRVSWSAALAHLRNLELIDSAEIEELTPATPRGGDLVELGEWWVPELDPPSVPPDYGRRVVTAYRASKLTAARAVELLWGTVTEADLPEVEGIPVDALRREFDPLQ